MNQLPPSFQRTPPSFPRRREPKFACISASGIAANDTRRTWVPACAGTTRGRGFTLIELLVVLGIVALLLTLAVPRFFPSIDGAKETILADNLRNTRTVIDQYRSDHGRYPDSLEQLVEKKYLREIPLDPITESRETWIVVPPEEGEQGELYNIRSGAPGNGRDGRPYTEW